MENKINKLNKVNHIAEYERILKHLEKTELLDNEQAIELLVNRYKIPHINWDSKDIKAIDFGKLNTIARTAILYLRILREINVLQ